MLSRDGEKLLMPGVKVTFTNGQFETFDKELIKQLKATKYFGVDYFVSADNDEEEEIDNTPTKEGASLVNKTKEASEDTLRACPHCAFNAASRIGLNSHIRAKHPDKVSS